MQNREFVNGVVKQITLTVTQDIDSTLTITDTNNVPEIENLDCYEEVVEYFHERCFNLGMVGLFPFLIYKIFQ